MITEPVTTEQPVSNTALWDKVSKTNPEYTKKVEQRGGFTSIDAMYTIQRATEVFGPVGKGWRYRTAHKVQGFEKTGIAVAICDVTIEYGELTKLGDFKYMYGPVRAMHVLIDAKGRLDDDAPKKALTDGLTKALSHLGFSADVFLGMHDDTKYVADLRKEFLGEPKIATAASPTGVDREKAAVEWADSLDKTIGAIGSAEDLEVYKARSAKVFEFLKGIDRARALLVDAAFARRKEALLNAQNGLPA